MWSMQASLFSSAESNLKAGNEQYLFFESQIVQNTAGPLILTSSDCSCTSSDGKQGTAHLVVCLKEEE